MHYPNPSTICNIYKFSQGKTQIVRQTMVNIICSRSSTWSSSRRDFCPSRTWRAPACWFAALGHRRSGRGEEKTVTTAKFTEQHLKNTIFSPHVYCIRSGKHFQSCLLDFSPKVSFENVLRGKRNSKSQKQSSPTTIQHHIKYWGRTILTSLTPILALAEVSMKAQLLNCLAMLRPWSLPTTLSSSRSHLLPTSTMGTSSVSFTLSICSRRSWKGCELWFSYF